ncbi:MAG: hypothetical protein LZF62_380021 [Nitrospira sp.]|nr:MAG: hypothetical protein LZF62_380021 [Nitrospira sp.]
MVEGHLCFADAATGRVDRLCSAAAWAREHSLTVDTYGKWLPMGNKGAVDRLDGESGSRTVATGIVANSPSFNPSLQPSDSFMYFVELARGIEPPTGGLQSSPEPLSSHHSTASEPIDLPDPPLG